MTAMDPIQLRDEAAALTPVSALLAALTVVAIVVVLARWNRR